MRLPGRGSLFALILAMTGGACASGGRQEAHVRAGASDTATSTPVPEASDPSPTTTSMTLATSGTSTTSQAAPARSGDTSTTTTTAPPSSAEASTTTTAPPETSPPATGPCRPGTAQSLPPDDHDVVYYSIDRGGFLTVRPDGTGTRDLAIDGVFPSAWWSPDGGLVAYQGHYQTWVVKPDGTDRRPLEASGISELAWSPDGQRFAVTMATGAGGRDVFVLDSDGKVVRRLSSTNAVPSLPSWSPDGSMVAYSVQTPSGVPNHPTNELWLAPVAEGPPVRVATDAYGSAWSPDGCWIVTSAPGGVDLMRPDGSERRRLLSGTGWKAARWSPDGGRVALENWGGDGITLLEGPDFIPRKIFGGEAFDVKWSPTGRRLAFYGANTADGREDAQLEHSIWVIDRDGGGLLQLSSSSKGDNSPAW